MQNQLCEEEEGESYPIGFVQIKVVWLKKFQGKISAENGSSYFK